MSRHRLVRNLDLDAEMNDGSDSENELENEWDAMTADQRVLMDSGLEHVRSLLGDVATSDLTDKQIKDSLWYYYFDAEKTVSWMLEEKEKARKKAEKKNDVEPMDEDPAVAPPPPSPPPIASAPSLPLTALQRLSLSRQAKSNLPSKAPSPASTSSPTPPPTVGDQPQPKLSKLALLAKSRAAAASSPSVTTAPSPTPQEPAPSSPKPLSKLQLKLLAAKEAKALLALPPAPPPPPPPPHPSTSCFLPPSSDILLQPTSFSRLLALPRSSPKLLKLEPPAGRTEIFSVLDVMGAERETIAKVFEGESPDDVVLRKREGTKLARAGGLEVAGKV